MENISEQFAKKIFDMSGASFPYHIVEKSKDCFIDYLSVVIGGCRAYTEIDSRFIEENKLGGSCHIIGFSQTSDLRTAVMMNAFHAHILELDDSHRVAMTHLGASIFSALIGVAEVYGCTLDDILHAAVVGYEAAIRLANAIQPSHKKRGFHVSGTCCTVGCAMGIAAMLRYSQEEMGNVLSAACTTAAGLLGVISGTSEQKPYNVANAAVAGVNAAIYGKLFKGAADILCDSRGFFHAMSDEFHIEKLFEGDFAIETIYQKLYAACRHCHSPMEAVLLMKTEENFSADEIDRIEVKTYDLAIVGHDHTVIKSVSSAKQSIPYGVAVAFIKQDCGMEAFKENVVSNQEILNLAKKVSVVEDDNLTSLVPAKRAAVVTAFLKNGTHFLRRVDYPKGEPENPITRKELAEKYFSLTRSADIDKKTGSQLLNFVLKESDNPASHIFQWV